MKVRSRTHNFWLVIYY